MKPHTQIEYRPLSELHELPGNPRTIKKDQFEKLKTSIQNNSDYFEARPLILSDRTGELVILAVRNFAREYLGDDFSFIYASKKPLEDYVKHYDGFQDTFYFECDRIHEIEFEWEESEKERKSNEKF